ncbi:MAG TPA: efflux RND transporter periplasmic adaptor subunit [Bryobacteraceae bacterium]|nr:efflux RND transporter periplasmic adaptor subunit [Bryobacteraceae bacterium]
MMRLNPAPLLLAAVILPLRAQTDGLATVVSKPVSRTISLPAEIQPYLSVALHAKVAGYVERILVDRGSVVKQGELLAELSAPEMTARIAEAESKAQAAQSDKLQADAQLAAAESTYGRLRKAAETPGAVAGNEVVQAQKEVEAAQALVHARAQASQAAAAAVRSEKDMEAYLKITAPFDGVVTDRYVHPGALVGPGPDPVLLMIQQISHLRLVVPVPEEDVGEMARGASVPFHVPAYPGRVYTGTVARISHALDPKTRTMPVELDVFNRDGTLAPGMYPDVAWPVRSTHPALFVPKTSVVTTTERTFVIRDRNGRAEWVDVKAGAAEGDSIEVRGELAAGDRVVRRATDELRDGMPIGAK